MWATLAPRLGRVAITGCLGSGKALALPGGLAARWILI